jgi:endonuclease/exonuclease/phosphatase family metal-dependent hydrolase
MSLLGPFNPQFSGAAANSRVRILLDQLETLKDANVIVFTEGFDAGYSKLIKEHLFRDFPYSTETLNGSYFSSDIKNQGSSLFHIINGGVFIVSKHKLTSTHRIYKDGIHMDQFASKGFLHVKLDYSIDGHQINVIGTHLQAEVGERAVNVREKQLDLLVDYAKEHIPSDHVVILAGDININYFDDEFENLRKKAEFPLLNLIGSEKYSLDTTKNEYLNVLHRGILETKLLDYVYPLGTHHQIKWKSEVIIPPTLSSYPIKSLFNPEKRAKEASDHFPVLGSFIRNK